MIKNDILRVAKSIDQRVRGIKMADKIDELNLKVILKIEGNATERLISAIKETANSKDLTVLTMDSIQSTRSRDFKNENARYLSVMENNLGVLKEALK